MDLRCRSLVVLMPVKMAIIFAKSAAAIDAADDASVSAAAAADAADEIDAPWR